MENKVSLVKVAWNGTDLGYKIEEALSLCGWKANSAKNVCIKLNLCYYWSASTGHTTDPRLVEVLIDSLRERYGADVNIKLVEADASAMRTKYAFPMLGYSKLAQAKKVELLNLSKDATEEREVCVNGRRLLFKVPKTLLESDLFINLPKLKIMRATHITCAMKNLFGGIASPRKCAYHPLLDESIVGINKILRPHLNLVDGLVALGRFPVRLGLVMAGETPFSIDWVAAQVMGYNPSRIRFLKLAAKEKLGNSQNVVVCGEKIEMFRKNFPTENNAISKVKMKLQFSLMKAYKTLSGDVLPPALES